MGGRKEECKDAWKKCMKDGRMDAKDECMVEG